MARTPYDDPEAEKQFVDNEVSKNTKMAGDVVRFPESAEQASNLNRYVQQPNAIKEPSSDKVISYRKFLEHKHPMPMGGGGKKPPGKNKYDPVY